MIRLKPLLLGVGLLIFGTGGLVYNQTRQSPPPVEWIPPIPLQAETSTAAGKEGAKNQQSDLQQRVTLQPPRVEVRELTAQAPVPPPVVSISSPATGTTFTSPATVTYEASISPSNTQATKVEFFLAETIKTQDSICNNSRDVQIPNAAMVKRGEVAEQPYTFKDTIAETGSYALYAVLTTKKGVRQISLPSVIIIHEPYGEGGREIKGWGVGTVDPHPSEGGALIQRPSPSSKPEQPPPCADFEVGVHSSPEERVFDGKDVTFTVHGAESGKNLIYKWKLSDGKIINGENTNSITVDTRGLGGTEIRAEVEVRDPDTNCDAKGSGSAAVFQLGGGNTYIDSDDILSRLDSFALELQNDPEAQGYVLAYGEAASCKEESVARATAAIDYLSSVKGIEPSRIKAVDGGFREERVTELWIVPAGADTPEPSPTLSRSLNNIPKCSSGELAALSKFGSVPDAPPPAHPYTKCPDVAERLNFLARLSPIVIQPRNFCPYNPNDPQNGETTIELSTKVVGIYGGQLTYKYTTNGGVIKGEGSKVEWDLSSVKYAPGLYTVVVEIDDGCGCTSVASTSVLITNFCTPCLSVHCNSGDPDSDTISLSASVPDWAIEKNPTFRWEVDQGRIIEGQGTPNIKIDPSGLDKGTRIVASVEVDGLYDYCIKKFTYAVIVGESCLTARKIDEYGNIRTGGIDVRRARRKKQKGRIILGVPADEQKRPAEQSDHPAASPPDGKEFIKIAWPNPVEVQRSFSIVIRYNLVKGALEVTDTIGEFVGPITTEGGELIKDKWGPKYDVWGTIKLQSAALGCEYGCRDDFKPLNGTEQKWTFNLKTEQEGEHTFNLEMWVEGRHISNSSRKNPEPVWSKENLKLLVKETPPTKNQIIISSAFLCFIGIVMTARGIRFGGFKVLIAGGNIIDGDVVGGHKVGGDLVGGDKVGGNKTGGDSDA